MLLLHGQSELEKTCDVIDLFSFHKGIVGLHAHGMPSVCYILEVDIIYKSQILCGFLHLYRIVRACFDITAKGGSLVD